MPVLFAYLAIGAAFLVAQEGYYQIHRRHHRAFWPPARRSFQLWPRLDETRAMLSATLRSDAVSEVERARRQFLAVWALAFIALVVVATSQIPR